MTFGSTAFSLLDIVDIIATRSFKAIKEVSVGAFSPLLFTKKRKTFVKLDGFRGPRSVSGIGGSYAATKTLKR